MTDLKDFDLALVIIAIAGFIALNVSMYLLIVMSRARRDFDRAKRDAEDMADHFAAEFRRRESSKIESHEYDGPDQHLP